MTRYNLLYEAIAAGGAVMASSCGELLGLNFFSLTLPFDRSEMSSSFVRLVHGYSGGFRGVEGAAAPPHRKLIYTIIL